MSPASPPATTPSANCWLLKAEPETRLERGKDVKFSVEDFKACKVTQWEGVRNHQAKNFMRDSMRLGDRALFYASNTKVPGVTAIAKICKEGYPDYSAWDAEHPYYDPKTNKDAPTWFMVDLEFVAELSHKVPLKLLQQLAQLTTPPACTPYLTSDDLSAIGDMFLIKRGRLSVQPVEARAYEAVVKLGEGGWEDWFDGGAGGGAKEGGKTRGSKKTPKKEEEDAGEVVKVEADEGGDGKSATKRAIAPKASDRPKRTRRG